MNLIDIQNISKRYGDHQALDNISFAIPDNSIFGLLGPNGAGKTTLIRIITQIIMSDQGEVLFNGVKLDPEHIRQIGYLPEERGLYKKMKVGEQLLYLAQLKGMEKREAVTKIKHWLKKLEISSWSNKAIEDLSKGMQQKIQFIATVVHEPSLIILDEPFSGFDPVNANLIKDEIFELREKGATVIFSTHRMESVEELCDDIALINHSKLVISGKKGDIKNQYRDNTFITEHIGDELIPLGGVEVLSVLKKGELVKTELKLDEGIGVNDLVTHITSQSTLVSLNEKIPSINDIFISTVNPSGHE
ncbi:ABC transporter ATP-binding protein [Reichenbachiella agariperforans]|uniref:ABC transporter ATP-binding protein n=1 Tax=Reichenbachiella agariperforans TaxID=156994 RepID=UPI001C083FDA|nr:ABC transporter ATP-binding protein [Reichenbachiella agariperforans]MBU2915989.1 ATP-binding cassette domain-containing protein [Reichenbachiella agariperforans]